MSREIRTFAEGALRWVRASGTGGWQTASAPSNSLIGFVQAGTNFASAQMIVTISERGTPHHHKVTEYAPPEITFTYLQAVSGDMLFRQVGQLQGVSTEQFHLEIKHTDTEAPSITAQYWQFMNCTRISMSWTEGVDGNQLQETWRVLSMIGPTASGYLG